MKGATFRFVTVAKKKGRAVDLSSPARTGLSEMRRQASDLGAPVATLDVVIRNQVTDKGKADVSLGATLTTTGVNPEISPGNYVIDVKFRNDVDSDDTIKSQLIYVTVVGEATHG